VRVGLGCVAAGADSRAAAGGLAGGPADAAGGASSLIGDACQACADQETGSAVIGQLDNGPIAQAGVSYTIIGTLNETVVTPVGSSFIPEPGVTNEYVQRYCPFDSVGHGDLACDPVVFQLVRNALDPRHRQVPRLPRRISCPRVTGSRPGRLTLAA